MRVRDELGHEHDAMRWLGRLGSVTIEALHGWGAPVDSPTSPGNVLFLQDGERRARVPVYPGDWIVRLPAGGHAGSGSAFRAVRAINARYTPIEEDEAPEAPADAGDPFPGLQRATFARVAWRRWTVAEVDGRDGRWEFRHGGLTRAEAERGGWEALYTLEVPGAEQLALQAGATSAACAGELGRRK